MKCENCQVIIPPEWKNVILKNQCPNCDQTIMSESSKLILDELKEAMSKMPNDPDGLATWIFSNYTLVKVGEALPVTQFYGQKAPRNEGTPLKVHPGLVGAVEFQTKESIANRLAATGGQLLDNGGVVNEMHEVMSMEDREMEAAMNAQAAWGAPPVQPSNVTANYFNQLEARVKAQQNVLAGGDHGVSFVGGQYKGVRRGG